MDIFCIPSPIGPCTNSSPLNTLLHCGDITICIIIATQTEPLALAVFFGIAFLAPCLPTPLKKRNKDLFFVFLPNVRTTFAGLFNSLIQPPIFNLFRVTRKQHIGYFMSFIISRTGINGRGKPVILECI